MATRSFPVIAALAAAAIGLTPCIAAPARPAVPVVKPANWLDVVVATPEGGVRQGNPNAKVRLLEFGSLSCPHCAAFSREIVPIIRAKYIATGRVSYEYRPFVNNGADFAPALLVRCEAPVAALRLVDALYDQQAIWLEPFTKPLPDDVQKRLTALPPEKQINAFALNGGLDGFMRPRGMTRARFDACTTDKAAMAGLDAIRRDANTHYGLTSLPTFAINGRTVAGAATWEQVKPALDRAL